MILAYSEGLPSVGDIAQSFSLLDQVPGVDGLHCAVGFSGHGFKVSPMIGMTMSELITGGRPTSIDISQLRLNRFVEGDLVSSSYRYRVLA